MGGGAASTRAAGAEGFRGQPPRLRAQGPCMWSAGDNVEDKAGTLRIGELVVGDLEERL